MTSHAHTQSNWVTDLAWPEVARRLDGGALALLPIGAGAKEHGRHLPLGTDYVQAVCFADRIAAEVDTLIWPIVSYGFYPVFSDYPGSTSVGAETFASLVRDVLASIDRAGACAAVILNTGVSTTAALRRMLDDGHGEMPIKLLNCYAGPRFSAAVAAIEQQPFGGHADEIETALMLAIEPARVHMEYAHANLTEIRSGRFNRLDPQAPNYSPDGVNGDPSLATRTKGQRLLAALCADLLDGVRNARRR